MSEQEFQQKYLLLQYLKEQSQALIQDMNVVHTTLENVSTAQEALKTIDKEHSKEILVPLGGSSFVKAKITDPDSVLVGVSGDIVVKKSRKDAFELLQEREEQLNNASAKLESQIRDVTSKMVSIEKELQEVAQKSHSHAASKKKPKAKKE